LTHVVKKNNNYLITNHFDSQLKQGAKDG